MSCFHFHHRTRCNEEREREREKERESVDTLDGRLCERVHLIEIYFFKHCL